MCSTPTHSSNKIELFLCQSLIGDLLDQFHEDLVVHVLQVSTDCQLGVSELHQVRDLFTHVQLKLIHYLLHTVLFLFVHRRRRWAPTPPT